jgi:hypothetical protein
MGRVPVIPDVRYNRVKGYSQNHTVEYTTNTRNEHRNTQCDCIKLFILSYFIQYIFASLMQQKVTVTLILYLRHVSLGFCRYYYYLFKLQMGFYPVAVIQ